MKLAKFIPWDEFEIANSKSLTGSRLGSPAVSVRIALGALIIKEKLGTSDEETVEQIRENPHLQYFIGFKDYRDEEPFHPTMFVHFRKRIGKKAICEIIETINRKARASNKKSKKKHKDDDDGDNGGSSASDKQTNKGKLLIDATCTPADITFPTDLKILNEAREKSEKIIDILHAPHKGKVRKPRTYRKLAGMPTMKRWILKGKLQPTKHDLDFIPNRSTLIKFTVREITSGFAKSMLSGYLVRCWVGRQRMKKDE